MKSLKWNGRLPVPSSTEQIGQFVFQNYSKNNPTIKHIYHERKHTLGLKWGIDIDSSIQARILKA